MSVVRSKICGITRLEDALAAVAAGADAIGLVFYARSPRAVSVQQAQAILAGLPPFVTTVGLFVDMPQHEIEAVLAAVPLDLLQFHGNERAADCDALARPYIKALRVRAEDDVAALVDAYPGARAVLLDTYVDGVPGGTGQAFDWALVPAVLSKPVILAGGLTADNVPAAITQVRPYAVDVSGGVEASKGIKDAAKVKDFVRAVRAVGELM
ncbi:phosphoribosylanthranilate isomerase [Pseudomonas argentinensis]|uniref:N-(5'-phosphoribosyl)anthranilate isomerase n=1 Tax=Phytopseudomonas argentinensis TaxID=289370 RepID=A0A1I3H0M4_9GAMM|nr:phosphoribosylanthranilate isomerase [Pseudomonas argentinensis]KAB0548751.1 phosphoribosylanthranilate isomerase [Pseudomonas argentinensis]SFI29107.1 phosphoribosylanthranilate isomerase [Pseudomonas argentinensis]